MGHESNHDQASTTPDSRKLTPRQKQMLELASIELSDNEIAARLNLSPRRIRFQLETIFRMFGVRNRSEAIAMWMDSKRPAPRPIDECPYPKPFPANFEECPGYQALQVVTPDQKSRPAGRIWTCRHLEGRLMARTRHRWYGACALGDTVNRKRWTERVGPDRLRTLNQLLHELAPVTGSFAQRLWELKGDQVRALEQKQDPKPATLLMESMAGRFMGDIEAFLERRRRLLEQNQLAIDECLNLARRQIDRVLDQGSPAAWDNRFDVLMRLPEDVWSASLSNSRAGALQATR
ncbi:MAG: helix-turn-helix transcriptional regulator [Chloroflexi bacterium]|nr:MAG: helix-turn-helix transcriptional regulator [Chloroflexota bacterium]TMD83627.1 MAG: helix-turn-helix transcriptional regulator [Chloroflexota bacterium]